ncbi:HDOD domain-containing protein [Thermodesulfobacterium sp. TA1]|uniref:HDOD domain-containing protein n=1 Tax=Thermodesulfobacterium sp. TA1 TaxID=2234087 RepID=UPI001232B9E6|nr:HDOD domain-containing protein [Thermodesulfobacterium sp. TA1]QER42308.1 HDOD domain-containing protein [Thermodesulfobacterium sp. TA1]
MIEQVLEKIFDKVDKIPTFPKVAMQALELLRKEEVDLKEVERVIKSDPGIVANFLKIVNSPAFGLPQKVDSLFKALMLLGVNQIKFIIVASVAKNYFEKDLIGYGISSEDIWLHSLACGFIAEEIALDVGFSINKIEAVYVASVLHDIGKIVLDIYTKLELNKFIKTYEENIKQDFLQVEWLVLGVDHGLVGATLLQRWGFPENIYFAIRAHHDPDLMLQSDVAAIVALSNMLTNMLGIGGGVDVFKYKVPSQLLSFLGLKQERLLKYMKIGLYKSLVFKKEF